MKQKVPGKLPFLIFLAVLSTLSVSSQQLDPTFGTNGISVTEYPYSGSFFSYSAAFGTEGFLSPDGGINIFGTQDISYRKSPGSSTDTPIASVYVR